jgi:hypothetical protein
MCLHLQASGVYLSDIPRYDLSSDYILLAEQRQAEADLKDKYERLTLELQVLGAVASTTLLVSSYFVCFSCCCHVCLAKTGMYSLLEAAARRQAQV